MKWTIIPSVEPLIRYFPDYVVIEQEQDPWFIVFSFYEHYDWDHFKYEFDKMYWAAAHDSIGFHRKRNREGLDNLYKVLIDFVLIGYILSLEYYKNNSANYRQIIFTPQREPEIKFYGNYFLNNMTPNNWDRLFSFYELYDLEYFRAELWTVFKSASQDKVMYRGGSERHDLIFLYERMLDLATAFYVIAKQQWLLLTDNSRRRKQSKPYLKSDK